MRPIFAGFALLLLVSFPARASAPVDPALSGQLEPPTPRQRIERLLDDALPRGTSMHCAESWLQRQGARTMTDLGAFERRPVWVIFAFIDPGRGGLAQPHSNVL